MSPCWLLCLSAALGFAAGQQCTGFLSGSEESATVAYKTTSRRGESLTDVTQAVMSWRPKEMLSDLACYDIAAAVLLFKTDKEEGFTAADVDQRSAGEASTWTVQTKPCLGYTFAVKVPSRLADGEAAVLELPQTLGPAPADQVRASKYIPEPPKILAPEVFAQYAVVNWEEPACAEEQYIYHSETGGSGKESAYLKVKHEESGRVTLDDLKPCTSYDVQVVAYLGDREGTSDVTFATKPRLDAAAEMEVTVEAQMTQAEVSMEVWKVPCIGEYEVTVCKAADRSDCQPTALIVKEPAESYVSHVAAGLSPCTDYVLEIQPLYPDTEVEKKEVAFKTLSPSAAESSVGAVSAAPVSSGSVELGWPAVTCAAAYRIYQRQVDDGGEWEQVTEIESDKLDLTLGNILPCTRYSFAVTALLNGEETEKSEGGEVVSDLSEEDAFEAPNLLIQNADDHAVLSWDHAACIDSYTLRYCQEGSTSNCNDVALNEGYGGVTTIEHKLEGLSPCTRYSLEIVPVIPGKTFTARTEEFTTTNGVPQAPRSFEVVLEADGTAAGLTWEPVQCATGYNVKTKTEEGEESTVATTETAFSAKELEPCRTYYFTVSTLVVEQESEPTEESSLLVPPVGSVPPVLKVLNNENDTVTLRLEPAAPNGRCRAAEFEVGYSRNGARPYQKRVFPADSAADDDDLVVSFEGASSPHMIVQGRMRYDGTNVWSEVASSREPGDRSRISQPLEEASDPGATLVPIVVGAIVGLVLLVLVVVFLVRKRRARDRYDAEKANGTNNGKGDGAAKSEETQKLNESHPDA